MRRDDVYFGVLVVAVGYCGASLAHRQDAAVEGLLDLLSALSPLGVVATVAVVVAVRCFDGKCGPGLGGAVAPRLVRFVRIVRAL